MTRIVVYSLCIYFAFAWQAVLRPELAWNGFAPNFLALALIVSCVLLTDVSGLFAAAVLGLLSDSLAPQGLGPHVLCYLTLIIALQGVCPPKLVRNPAVLLIILFCSTVILEFSCEALRATLNHELSWSDPRARVQLFRWAVIALGDGVYTATLALVPLLIARGLTNGIVNEAQDPFSNRWHRLTSH